MNRGLLLALAGASALSVPGPAARVAPPHSAPTPAAAPAAPLGRRGALLGALAAGALAAAPRGAHASYAMYAASQETWDERKAAKYVPVATSDVETLREIQTNIRKKRPAAKEKKKPQYCAGQMSVVNPMYENICADIGISKADQSNTIYDYTGLNMDVGAYSARLDAEKAGRTRR